MKKTGIIILLIGLLFTVYEVFNLLVKEHVTDPVKLKTAQVKIHRQIWEPLFGAIMIMIGAGVYRVGRKAAVVKIDA